ncbi:hypothetical protein Tco_0984034 [Tanacetum coccineum]
MVPATTSLTGFSGETIWPLGQLRLLVTIGDADHSTKAWMNFMIVRSLLPYNGIIGRPKILEIQAVPSTAHGMLKFPANGGIVTICSTILIPAECTTLITSSKEVPKEVEVRPKNFKIALHPNFPDQEVAIGRMLSLNIDSISEKVFACSTEEKGAGPGTCKGDPSGGLPPDTDGGVRRRKNGLPYQPRCILIYENALRPQERWCHIPATGGQSFR